MTEIGKILREIREEQGLPLKTVAIDAGCTERSVGAYERGESAPWSTLERILGALGYDLEIVKR